jgi:hypothetical protein
MRDMGKGWAKGLTAATDPRVARMAEAHRGERGNRGKVYQRRVSIELGRWHRPYRTTLALSWSSEMAYVVGLTATDRCLVTGRRKINFKSGDRDLVATYLALLGRGNPIKVERTKKGVAYYTQFHDSQLYDWFLTTGLTPKKSLTIGALTVPREYFFDAARGLLDGDGSIMHIRYAGTGKARGREYETIRTCFNSASRPHLEWIRRELNATLDLGGSLKMISYTTAGNPFYRLEYAMRDTMRILPQVYRDPTAPCLERKRRIWELFQTRLAAGETRSRLL